MYINIYNKYRNGIYKFIIKMLFIINKYKNSKIKIL